MFNQNHLHFFEKIKTPFYYYDLNLLKDTIKAILTESEKYNYHVHYALKANTDKKVLTELMNAGFGADCVSGNEIKCALNSGYKNDKIVFAGVGKSDEEIILALKNDIFCFNCESLQELEVINQLATKLNTVARIALRINPNVNANTHKYITTGLEENKFGINPYEFDAILEKLNQTQNLKLIGFHFHIGSQITDLAPFKNLCTRVNEIQTWFNQRGHTVEIINVGGGLGVNYKEPDIETMPDFTSYFKIFNDFLELRKNQQVHFELGRAIVGQCGSLISKVLYIKNGINTNFAILDAGMTELIRPALYQAYHKIENLSKSNNEANTRYDIVGPICESSDCFGKAVYLPETHRGDIFAIRTAGAYGEVMTSQYNLREKNKTVYSDELNYTNPI